MVCKSTLKSPQKNTCQVCNLSYVVMLYLFTSCGYYHSWPGSTSRLLETKVFSRGHPKLGRTCDRHTSFSKLFASLQPKRDAIIVNERKGTRLPVYTFCFLPGHIFEACWKRRTGLWYEGSTLQFEEALRTPRQLRKQIRWAWT